ncbi:MerC domain-containing protein [Hyphococcus lacteus]|uniref:MerC domain-containing protein n=1 Tax=Hyphococcus lacteus TaxID=3143536 RepID=A0ABV3Z7V3_9PROT
MSAQHQYTTLAERVFSKRSMGGLNTASFDYAAVGVSCLCVMHCLALPLIGSALPIVGSLSDVEWIHKALVLIAIPISGFAILTNSNRIRDLGLVMIVILSVICLIGGAFVESLHFIEQPLTSMGAFMLSATHFVWWWRHHRSLT